jgi:hypothetical protein
VSLPVLEQLRQTHGPRVAPVPRRFLEAVVERHLAAERQAASLRCNSLGRAAQFDLGLDQFVSGAPVLLGLARKRGGVERISHP